MDIKPPIIITITICTVYDYLERHIGLKIVIKIVVTMTHTYQRGKLLNCKGIMHLLH
jgi:hypothetical protein